MNLSHSIIARSQQRKRDEFSARSQQRKRDNPQKPLFLLTSARQKNPRETNDSQLTAHKKTLRINERLFDMVTEIAFRNRVLSRHWIIIR